MAQAVLIELPASIEASKVEEVIMENFPIPGQEIKIIKIPEKKAKKVKKEKKAKKRHAKYHQELECINNVKAKLDASVYRSRMNFA